MSPQKPSRAAPIMMVVIGVLLMVGSFAMIATANSSQPVVNAAFLPTSVNQTMGALPPLSQEQPGEAQVERLTLADAKAAFDGNQAVFLDVRGQADYQAGHIPGAVSISINDLSARLGELDKNDWIITYCT